MGQCHYICNLDRHEYLSPYTFGSGAKLMEFGSDADGPLKGLAVLTACSNGRGGGDLHIWTPDATDSRGMTPFGGQPTPEQQATYDYSVGRWTGQRIAIIGDYYVPGDIPGYDKSVPWADPTWADISEKVVEALCLDYYHEKQVAW